MQRIGLLLHLDISRPTKGLKVQLWYGDCGIRYVNVLGYIASAERPRISRTPDSVPTPSIEVGFDGWVFPQGRGGIRLGAGGEMAKTVGSTEWLECHPDRNKASEPVQPQPGQVGPPRSTVYTPPTPIM